MQIKNLSFTAPDTSFLTNGSRSYNIAVSLVVFAQLIVNWLLTSIGNILTAGMDRRIRDKCSVAPERVSIVDSDPDLPPIPEFNPQISQITPLPSAGATGQGRVTLIT
jgi:hypothetical protein